MDIGLCLFCYDFCLKENRRGQGADLQIIGGGGCDCPGKGNGIKFLKVWKWYEVFQCFWHKTNKFKNVVFKHVNRGWNGLWALGFVYDVQNKLFILLLLWFQSQM